MKKLIQKLSTHKLIVLVFFLVASLISIFSQSLVKINYDLASYLPEQAESTKAVEVMASQFKEEIFNINIMIPNASVSDALDMKEKIKELPETLSVFWLDDYVDVTLPLNVLPAQMVNSYYKDQNALFQVTIKTNDSPGTLDKLQELVGDQGHVSGRLVELAMAQSATQSEIAQIMLYVVPIVSVVLILATHSWLEPILMLAAMGVGILLNMGTNVFLGEISFLTQAVAAILQLAVSMDYAIFLLHRFSDYRSQYESTEEAMLAATVNSLPTLMASSITTFIGFLALVLMRFKIGPDMGLVLAKGVAFSILSVLAFLPVITIYTVKWIDKTTHKSYLPSFDKFAHVVRRVTPVVIVVVLLIAVPSYLAQRKNQFMYGMGAFQSGSREERDHKTIRAIYGAETQMVILVPKGQWAIESDMIKSLQSLPEVKSVMSYITMVGPNIPYQLLPESQMSSLLSQDYSRIILQVVSEDEGNHAFGLVEQVREIVDTYYPDDQTYLVGSSVITYDMATTIQADDVVVNGLAILAIFLTILFTFKSLSVPVILVFAIEISIWINLSFPYFTQSPLNYIGYLIISTVQLGATVDYGVLYSQNYLEHRQTMDRKEALIRTVKQSAASILPPALILTATGFILGMISSIQMVAELGITLGRGALLSLTLVLFFVPGAYYFLDKIVEKTTMNTNFYRKEVSEHEEVTN